MKDCGSNLWTNRTLLSTSGLWNDERIRVEIVGSTGQFRQDSRVIFLELLSSVVFRGRVVQRTGAPHVGWNLDVPLFSAFVCVQGCGSGTILGRHTALPSTPARSSSSRKLWPPKIDTRRYTHPSAFNPPLHHCHSIYFLVTFFLLFFFSLTPLPSIHLWLAIPLCFSLVSAYFILTYNVRMFLIHKHAHTKDVRTLPLLNSLLLRLLHHTSHQQGLLPWKLTRRRLFYYFLFYSSVLLSSLVLSSTLPLVHPSLFFLNICFFHQESASFYRHHSLWTHTVFNDPVETLAGVLSKSLNVRSLVTFWFTAANKLKSN